MPSNTRIKPHGIDAIIVGCHGDGGLTYVARIRNGFVPASRRQVFEKLRPLARVECPFVNLPETRQTRWGEALTAEKMKKCIWVNPELVAQIAVRPCARRVRIRSAGISADLPFSTAWQHLCCKTWN